MSVIITNALTKCYGRARGITDVSMAVEEGEIFGFIGPNGAGKSTTIRTLLGLLRPTSGSATIFGKDIVRQSTEIRRDVGYLPGEVFYYDGMRVLDLLNYSASFYRRDCSARIRELAGALELDLKRKIDDLSFGNKKKVGIVQGLLHEPRLLILDEPTTGLDPLMQQTFFSLLREENRKGVTVLFSSHILSEVQRLCSRVAIIREGRIVRLETVAGLRSASTKKFSLEFDGPADPAAFALDGVTDLAVSGNRVTFLLRGDFSAVLRAAASRKLVDIDISEPSLEEIFLHYYEREA